MIRRIRVGESVELLSEVAGGPSTGTEFAQSGRFGSATGFGDGAAWVEGAPGGRMQRGWNVAAQDDAAAARLGIKGRDGREESLGVGMLGGGAKFAGGAEFDEAAEVKDGDALTEVFDHGEVMGNE